MLLFYIILVAHFASIEKIYIIDVILKKTGLQIL